MRDNDALFREGIESFLIALRQRRADGSPPLDTTRLQRAIDGLARALADPALVSACAHANRNLSFMAGRGHRRHHMAWLEA